MAEDILDDIVRLRRQITDAARDQSNGKDIGGQLASINDELGYLLEKTESRLDEMDRETLDARTRLVSEISARLLRTIMKQRGSTIGTSEVQQSVDMALMIVQRVQDQT